MIKPLYKKQAGRPAKLRRIQHDELINPKGTKMSRHYVKVKCGRCGKEGHNQRSCIKLQEAAEQVLCINLHFLLVTEFSSGILVIQFHFLITGFKEETQKECPTTQVQC